MGFFLALRVEDLRLPLRVMLGAAGVEASGSLVASPLSLADAMISSD